MEIIYSGGSHYGEGALRSIQKYFDKVYILSKNNSRILALKRENDVLIDDFSDCSCNHVFLGGYPNFINEYQLKEKTYINVHGSLLPKYRGMHSTFWAIMNGEKKLGITFHLVDKYMDSGDILAQYSFDYYGQTVQEINYKIDRLIEENAGKVVKNYLCGNIRTIQQKREDATFGCKRNLSDCIIDFNMNNQMLNRFFKALTPPYPLPRIIIKGQEYEVLEFSIIERNYYCEIGGVLNVDEDGIWIKTKEGFLIVSVLRDLNTGKTIDPRQKVKIGYRFI